jgi:hypothetical protein
LAVGRNVGGFWVEEEEAHACSALVFSELESGVGAGAHAVYAQMYQVRRV